ncbi:SURF1 family protein [Sphingomonas sp. RG327]|jgi:cytochrome oxidase assembly protein ShyY1|uniref:SURF1-like protein n=1 Tax=Sphingomonas anseongensis TaxID=2908207 RepID=A0ABT0RFX9_9SPHN|nr:SURF1 family protein [Sphingomonas anseongensis]MCL6679133.1 SURF1 family protein [Sphingomonas anseongensis]
MKRVPIFATLLVALAVATMIALGVWQISRGYWKDQLIHQYTTAQKLPPISFPTAPYKGELPLFRWATGFCVKPDAHRAIAGRNRQGETGYVHIIQCSTGAEGPGMAVEIGWSEDPNAKYRWAGGPVSGMIAPDRQQRIRLVAASAPPGLQPAAPPSIESIPNNHRSYAFQWFAFALVALVIYFLALRKRFRPE